MNVPETGSGAVAQAAATQVTTVTYDDAIAKKFVLATLTWGLVAMLVGVWIAYELANWRLNMGIPEITFSRLRPLHTNAAIFAFAGNAIFAGIYYSTQRLTKARMFSDTLSTIHFWGWQAIIVAAEIPAASATGSACVRASPVSR